MYIFRCNAIAVLPGVGKSCQRSPVPFSHFHKNTLVSKSNFLSRTKPASFGFRASAVVGGRLVEGAAACPTDAAPGLEQAGMPLSLTHFWGKGRKLRVKGSSFGSSSLPSSLPPRLAATLLKAGVPPRSRAESGMGVCMGTASPLLLHVVQGSGSPKSIPPPEPFQQQNNPR